MADHTTRDAQYLTLAEAARLVPGRPNVSTIWRWARKGVRARSGERVHLTHLRFGSRVLTTLEAIEEFGRALADADRAYFEEAQASASAGQMSPAAARQAAQEAAERELAQEGL